MALGRMTVFAGAVRLLQRGHFATVLRVTLLRALTLVVNFGTITVTARVLGPEGRGEQGALVVALQFLAAVSTLALDSSLIYNSKTEPRHESRLIGCALLLCMATSMIVAGACWPFLPVWLSQYGPETVAVGRWMLLLVPFGAMGWVLSGALSARGRFVFENRMHVTLGAVTLGILFLLAWTGHLTPATAALTIGLQGVTGFVCFTTAVWRSGGIRLTTDSAVWRPLVGYGLRRYWGGLMSAFSSHLDRLLMVVLLEPAAIGHYTVALSLSRILIALQGAVAYVLFPNIAGRDREAVIETVARAIRISTPAAAAAALALGLLSPLLLTRLFGAGFAPAVAPLCLLLVQAVLFTPLALLYQAFSATGRPGMVSVFEGIGTVVTLGGILLLAPAMGAAGVAAAVLLATTIQLLVVLVSFRLVLGLRTPRLMVGRDDLRWIVGHG